MVLLLAAVAALSSPPQATSSIDASVVEIKGPAGDRAESANNCTASHGSWLNSHAAAAGKG
jgi:hypothetical protein